MELYFGGQIYTMLHEGEKVEAVLVHNGEIMRTGTYQALQHEASTFHNLRGKTMIPGLVDSHIHLIGYGEKLSRVQLGNAKSKEEIIKLLIKEQKNLSPNEWLIAEGWSEFNLEGKQMLSLQELDVITTNPTILHRVCHHVLLANSAALKLANITSETLNPSGGAIGRDSNGLPNGYFYDEATQLINNLIDTESLVYKQHLVQSMNAAIKQLHTYGVVGAHTEDCSYYGHYSNVLQAYQETIGQKKHFRTHLLRHHKVFEEMLHDQPKETDGFIEFGAMKIFADGSFGGSTAALLAPYKYEGTNCGLFIHTQEQFESYVKMARSYNEAIAVHMIGDAAAELVVSMIEKYPTPKGKRDRLIHACLLNEQLLERMRKLPQIIMDIQPAFVPSDYPWIEQKLGVERMRYAYAWKTLKEFHPAIGTDAPIEDVNPFKTIEAAVNRHKYGSRIDNEQLSVFEAVKMYTHGSAYAVNKEMERGFIAPHYVADFTILKQNIFECSPDEIERIQVCQTIVDGKVVYDAEIQQG